MKIIVAIKQVPERDAQIRIAADGKWIDESDLNYAINEPDAYALEEALQLKEKHGGEVVVLCAGPERVTSTIARRWPRARTAPSTSRPTISAQLDTLGVAQMLAEAIKAESPDLVLTGLQSDDLGLGQTGVVLAELLGMPHATIIMQVEVDRLRPQGEARARRRLVPARRDAAARAADDPVGRQQAALRHADGHQEGEDEGDEDGRRLRLPAAAHGR